MTIRKSGDRFKDHYWFLFVKISPCCCLPCSCFHYFLEHVENSYHCFNVHILLTVICVIFESVSIDWFFSSLWIVFSGFCLWLTVLKVPNIGNFFVFDECWIFLVFINILELFFWDTIMPLENNIFISSEVCFYAFLAGASRTTFRTKLVFPQC